MIIKRMTCLRCGYQWYPRTPGIPKNCASKKCRSPYWNIPRGQKRGKKVGKK